MLMHQNFVVSVYIMYKNIRTLPVGSRHQIIPACCTPSFIAIQSMLILLASRG